MPNPYSSLVNQRLAYARMQLKALQAPEPMSGNKRLMEQSLLLGGLMHLAEGQLLYFKEIAYSYRIKSCGDVRSAAELLEVLNKSGIYTAEADEWLKLEQDPDSWVYQLNYYYNQRLLLESNLFESPEKPAEATDEGIPLVNIAAEKKVSPLTEAMMQQYVSSMQQLIEEHREVMVEW